jgi:hypothetical protein
VCVWQQKPGRQQDKMRGAELAKFKTNTISLSTLGHLAFALFWCHIFSPELVSLLDNFLANICQPQGTDPLRGGLLVRP